MIRIGVLSKEESQLDYVLVLTSKQFLERRVQTIVFQCHYSQSIHHVRTLIFQKTISFNRGLRSPVINIPIVFNCQKRK